MLLKDQLEQMKGCYVKIGSKLSFVYCQKCDDNIYDTLYMLGKDEYKRILETLAKTKKHLETFETRWEKNINRRVECLEKKQKNRLAAKIKVETNIYKRFCKTEKLPIDEEKIKEIKSEITEKYNIKFAEEMQELLTKANDDKAEDYRVSTGRLENYTLYKQEFMPFIEREVIEVYPSIVEKNTFIIKVTGHEQGRFWDRDEYDKYMQGKVIADE